MVMLSPDRICEVLKLSVAAVSACACIGVKHNTAAAPTTAKTGRMHMGQLIAAH